MRTRRVLLVLLVAVLILSVPGCTIVMGWRSNMNVNALYGRGQDQTADSDVPQPEPGTK